MTSKISLVGDDWVRKEADKKFCPETPFYHYVRSRVGFEEFVKWWKEPNRMKILETADNPVIQQAIEYFQRYDADSNGNINVEEYKKLCSDLGWPTDNVTKSLQSLDKNSDGVIDFNEFLIWLRWDVK